MDTVRVAHVVVYLLSALVTAAAGRFVWRARRRAPIAAGFAAVLWTGTWWSVFELVQDAAVSIGARDAALFAWMVGVGVVAVSFTVLVRLLVDERWRASRLSTVAAAGYVLALVVALAVPGTRSLFVRSTRIARNGDFVWEPGPGFWGLTAVQLVGFAVLAMMLTHGMRHARRTRRRQLALVLRAAGLVVLLSLVSVAPVIGVGAGSSAFFDFAPLGFVGAAVLFVWWVVTDGVLIPVRGLRGAVVDEMDDAIVILDRSGRITDLNPAAVSLLGTPHVIGAALEPTLARLGPDVLAQNGRYRLHDRQDGEVDLRIAPLAADDDPEDVIGTVVVVRDVTEQALARNRLVASNLALRDDIRSLHLTRQEIAEAAYTDPDTGLANRRRLLEVLDAVVDEAEAPIAVVRIAVDLGALRRAAARTAVDGVPAAAPGTEPGSEPGSEPGTQPDAESDAKPETRPHERSATAPGSAHGPDDGAAPARATEGGPSPVPGSAVLVRRLAEALGAVVTPPATLGRIAGAGFAVVLPGADAESARRLVEQVRADLARGPEACPIGAGISAVGGRAAGASGRVEPYVLLARAEEALVDSLARGRGQVVIDRRA